MLSLRSKRAVRYGSMSVSGSGRSWSRAGSGARQDSGPGPPSNRERDWRPDRYCAPCSNPPKCGKTGQDRLTGDLSNSTTTCASDYMSNFRSIAGASKRLIRPPILISRPRKRNGRPVTGRLEAARKTALHLFRRGLARTRRLAIEPKGRQFNGLGGRWRPLRGRRPPCLCRLPGG